MKATLTRSLSEEDLWMLKSSPSVFLAYFGLRAALKSQQLATTSFGYVICVVPKGYRAHDYRIAGQYFFSKDAQVGFGREMQGHRVYEVGGEEPAKKGKDSSINISVFELADASLILTTDLAKVPAEILFAAEEVLSIPAPTALHINMVRRLSGLQTLSRQVASNISTRPQQIVVAALSRRAITMAHLNNLDANASADRTGPTLSELPGYGELKDWVREVRADVTLWRAGDLKWNLVARGALLSGAPGVGKSYFAQAFANECGLQLIPTTVGDWQRAGHLDDTLNAMNNAFESAAKAGGAVLFIDEIDGIGVRSTLTGDYVEYWQVVINHLLALLSTPTDGVIVLGATNYPERIDPAVLRSGRIEKKFILGPPNQQERSEILSFHLDRAIDPVQLLNLVENLEGHTASDIEELARKVKGRARREKRTVVLGDVVHEVPPRRPFSKEERFRLAVHESGHALIALGLGYARSVTISLRQSFDPSLPANIGGYASYVTDDEWLPTEKSLLIRIAVALAGLAAEEVVFGDRSIGSGGGVGSDVERATVIARRFVGSYGLGKYPVYFRRVEDFDNHRPMNADAEAEVAAILGNEYQRVLSRLEPERHALLSLAEQAAAAGSLTIGKPDDPSQELGSPRA